MKHQLLLGIVFSLILASCTKESSKVEGLKDQWTLIEYSNILGEVYCQYEEGDVVWTFENNELDIDGQLVTPWAFVPCYEVDSVYAEVFDYTITESEDEDVLFIEDFGLTANISIDGEELILEIISSTEGFRPQTEGVKVFFRKM